MQTKLELLYADTYGSIFCFGCLGKSSRIQKVFMKRRITRLVKKREQIIVAVLSVNPLRINFASIMLTVRFAVVTLGVDRVNQTG